MIKQFNVEKALRDYLKSLVTLDVVNPEQVFDTNGNPNGSYKPNSSVSYIREKVMLGNTNITLTPGDAENVNGIHQIDLYAGLSDNALKSRFASFKFIDSLKSNYTKGLSASIEFDGQKIIINEVNTPSARINEQQTHRIHTLDVNFRVVG